MIVISWNVLFRDYEILYNASSSKILKKYPEEKIRIDNIVNVIKKLAKPDTIFCLQECSELLIKLCKDIFVNRKIFYRKANSDYLVTITPENSEFVEEEQTVQIQRQYLSVSNKHFRIINCHLRPQKFCEIPLFEMLNTIAKNDKTNIISGDFNEPNLGKYFPNYTVPFFGCTYKNQTIDSIIISKKNMPYTAFKISPKGHLSDHKIVKAQFLL